MRKYLFTTVVSLFLTSCGMEEEPPPTKYNVSITLNPTDGGTVSPNGGQFDEGQTILFTVTPSENYIFKNWSGSDTSSNNPLSLTINSNITLTVNFVKKDTDKDGVSDDLDQCPNTPNGEDVNEKGCPVLIVLEKDGVDEGKEISQTLDGGFLISGYSTNYNLLLLKTDISGKILWEKSFNSTENGGRGQITSDGGYVMTGNKRSTQGDLDIYLVKTNNSGEIEWDKTFGGNFNDTGQDVIQTEDGGFVIMGLKDYDFNTNTNTNINLTKTNNLGEILWEKSIGSNNIKEYGWELQKTSDNNLIVVGSKGDDFKGEVFIVKLDSNGNLLWNKSFRNGSGTDGFSVQQVNNGFIISGVTWNGGNTGDLYLTKLNNLGEQEWEKTYVTSGSLEYGKSVKQTSDGSYIITGIKYRKIYILKTDQSGNKQWEKIVNQGSDYFGFGNSIIEDKNGDYVITGRMNYPGKSENIFILFLHPNGNYK